MWFSKITTCCTEKSKCNASRGSTTLSTNKMSAAPHRLLSQSPLLVTCLTVFWCWHLLFDSAAMLGAAAAAGPLVPRPDIMRFATLVETSIDVGEANIALGVEAAFQEANETGILGPTKLVLDYVDSTPAFVLANFDNETRTKLFLDAHNNFTGQGDFYGFVAMSHRTQYAIERWYTSNKIRHPPSYGPRMFRNRLDSREQIALRGDTLEEIPFVIDFALHRKDVHCTRFIIILPMIQSIYYFFDLLDISLAAAGIARPRYIFRPDTPAAWYNETDLLEALTSDPDACLYSADQFYIFDRLFAWMGTNGITNRTMLFYSYNLVGSLAASKAHLQNVYASSILPSIHDSSVQASVRAKRAINATIARNATKPSTLAAFMYTDNIVPTHYEGYVVGRMLIQIIQGTLNVTRDDLLDTAYRSRIQVDDFTLAPVSDKCQQGFDMPCFCNVANKAYFMTRASTADGAFYPIQDDASNGEVKFVRRSAALSSCLRSGFAVRRPFNVLIAPPTSSATPMGASLDDAAVVAANRTTRIFAALRAGLNIRNSDKDFSGLGGIHIVGSSSGNSNTFNTLATAEKRFLPFVVLQAANSTTAASSVPPTTSVGLLLGASVGTFRVRDAERSSHGPRTLHLEPALAHYIHAHANALRSDAVVLADTETMVALAEQSLNTFGARRLSPPGLASAAIASTTAARTAAAAALTAAIAAGQHVIIATLDAQTLAALLGAAEGAAIPSSTALSPSVRIAAPELALQEATAALALRNASRVASPSAAAGSAPVVYFSSIFEPWWAAATLPGALAKTLEAAYGRRTTTDVAEVNGLYLAEATYALAQAAMAVGAGASATTAASRAAAISAAGVAVGPIHTTPCATAAEETNSQRQCGCSTGPRRFLIHNIADLLHRRLPTAAAILTLSSSSNPTATLALDGCTLLYQPLPAAAAADRSAMIIGATAGSSVALVTAIALAAVFLVCCAGRSHRTAPKDPQKPFAIVFTDIQSSTSLWARAPVVMTAAVDQHHTLIRKIIAQQKGYEVKTVGDSFMIAFATAEGACACAVGIQRAMQAATWPAEIAAVYDSLAAERAEERAMALSRSHGMDNNTNDKKSFVGKDKNSSSNSSEVWNGLRVRIGVHFGFGTITKDEITGSYDYYGTVVNTAARIEGVGHGGQTLLSKDAYDALDAAFIPSTLKAEVTPLGPQPLRGLDAPLELMQLLPLELHGRVFEALRLDIDRAQDNEGNGDQDGGGFDQDDWFDGDTTSNHSGHQNGGGGPDDNHSMKSGSEFSQGSRGGGPRAITTTKGNHHGPTLTAADAMVRASRRHHVPVTDIERCFAWTNTLLSVSPAPVRQKAIDAWMKRWHVPMITKTAAPVAPPATATKTSTAGAGTPTNNSSAPNSSKVSSAGSATPSGTGITGGAAGAGAAVVTATALLPTAEEAAKINLVHLLAKIITVAKAAAATGGGGSGGGGSRGSREPSLAHHGSTLSDINSAYQKDVTGGAHSAAPTTTTIITGDGAISVSTTRRRSSSNNAGGAAKKVGGGRRQSVAAIHDFRSIMNKNGGDNNQNHNNTSIEVGAIITSTTGTETLSTCNDFGGGDRSPSPKSFHSANGGGASTDAANGGGGGGGRSNHHNHNDGPLHNGAGSEWSGGGGAGDEKAASSLHYALNSSSNDHQQHPTSTSVHSFKGSAFNGSPRCSSMASDLHDPHQANNDDSDTTNHE